MGSGTWRAVVVGALLGLLCVIALVAAAVLGVFTTPAEEKAATKGPVLVALVLPDANGVLTVRALDRWEHTGTGLSLSSVDPLTSATVPGTSATTLADAYAFGGGDGLVAAYAESSGGNADGETPAWIAVGPDAWRKLMGSTSVKLRLRTGIEVFDGTELYSYHAGAASVPASEINQVMNGAAFLKAGDRKTIREGVGDALAPVLLREYASSGTGIITNRTPEHDASLIARTIPAVLFARGAY